jgi:hypothetical protein
MSEATPRADGHGAAGSDGPIHDWAAQLAQALGIPAVPVDVPLLLDAARDVAHSVNRPAVPVTMYLVGYAAAARGGSEAAAESACSETVQIALEWAGRAERMS